MNKHISFIFAAVAAFVLAACNKPSQVTVELANLSESEISVPASGSEELISFKSSAPWTVVSSQEWVFVGQESGPEGFNDVDIYVEANETGEERSATVTVSAGADNSFTITLVQEQNNVLSISETNLSIDSDGGQLTFTVKSNIEYEVTSITDWIKVVSSKGVSDNTVTLEIEENKGLERNGGVKVKSSEGEVLVRVSQEVGISDAIYRCEHYFYADWYNNGKANWMFNFFKVGYCKGGDLRAIYVFDVILDPEYDYYKVLEEGFPDGTYTLSNSGEPFTFTIDGTYIEDYTNQLLTYYTEATLTIEGNTYSFRMVDELGQKHKFQWTADSEHTLLRDDSYYSTITQDYEITFDTCTIQPLGKIFTELGIETYQTYVTFSDGHPQLGTAHVADKTNGAVLINSATSDFVGTYVVEPSNRRTLGPGTLDSYNSGFASSYDTYYYVEDSKVCLGSGTMTITPDGDGYLVEGDFKDDYHYSEPHKLVLHARGTVVEPEQSQLRALSPKRNNKDYRITF